MNRAMQFVLVALAAAIVVTTPSTRAQPANPGATPIYVLSVRTDDADDQADALTQAIRSSVRQTPGWALSDAPQSFETLAIALKCPTQPDPACLERIGDQLRADRYVWGTMTKSGFRHVTADLHLWARGLPGTDASETYGDDRKDSSDASLRAVASRLFAKLRGERASGTLVVLAGASGGTVRVDGVERGVLTNGLARIDVPAGSHTVAVRVAGFEVAQERADVREAAEKEVVFHLIARPAAGEKEQDTGPAVSIAKVVGYSALIAGGGLLVAAGVEAVRWLSDRDDSTNDRGSVPKSVTDVCAYASQPAQDACSKSKDASSASALGWIFAAAGAALAGTGAWLLLTDDTSDAGSHATVGASSTGATVAIVPAVSLRSGGVNLRVRF
jgi:hypothetical protein